MPRRLRPLSFWIVLLALGAAVAYAGAWREASAAPRPRAPVVTISTPADGVSTDRVIHISGTVDDPAVGQVTVVYNGTAYAARARNGAFYRNLVASPGQGLIEVYARNAGGSGRASVSLLSKVPRNDIQVVMWWDADATDLDLWVIDPLGEKCDYTHRSTKPGGSLDVDVTDGYGPETFTAASAVPGNYQVQVHFYGDRRPRELQRPILVHARVVLFEGTDREYKKDYSVWINRAQDVLNLTTFNVYAH